MLEQGATYEIEIGRPEGWMDGGIPVPTTDGFASVLPGSLKRLLEFRWRVAASKRAQRAYDAAG